MALVVNELDVIIGKKIRFFRKKNNIGLKNLSSDLGLSIQQLQKYETGQNKISASLLFEISRVLEVSIDQFFATIDISEEEVENAKMNFNILLISNSLDTEIIIREVMDTFPHKMDLYVIHEGDKVIDFLKDSHENSFRSLARPDIVLLEVHLHNCNGLDILQNIKKDKFFNSIPVVLLTESTNSDEILQSYNMHASGIIVQSASLDDFSRQMYDLINYWAQLVRLPGVSL